MPFNFYSVGDTQRVVPLRAQPAPEPYRSDFRRDYARVVHSTAFRRLQRKTQLFPGDESDFFRNRLTHSLEVAQIAKSIALRLNYLMSEKYGSQAGIIDVDLVETAALAHDIGHPPFGHTGEYALHKKMYPVGGFEGNAQTLRILARSEKRVTSQGDANSLDFTEFKDGVDQRAGLNLCYRTLAAVLKYDNPITLIGDSPKLEKGYYASEASLVEKIRRSILGDHFDTRSKDKLRVVEMQIMDIADDIAYSTYDLEDALKAGFGSPLDLLQQLNNNEDLRRNVARKLFKTQVGREFLDDQASQEDKTAFADIQNRMVQSVIRTLLAYLTEVADALTEEERGVLAEGDVEQRAYTMASAAVLLQKISEQITSNGYVRAQFTSELVGKRIQAIDIKLDDELPCLSEVLIPSDVRFEIDVLKHVTFELHIKSPRLKLIEYRGQQIVSDLFDCFVKDKDGDLLPYDWRSRVRAVRDFQEAETMRKRIVCDYISGMTDAYALDVYSRLMTTNPAALFRPS